MRITFLFFFLSVSAIASDALVIVNGGVSPDKRFAVAVVPQKAGESIDEADGTTYLLDQRSKKKIGPLEEVNSTGGTWGSTTENIAAQWSPDSRHLVINYRAGRLMWGFQLYRMAGRRTVPVQLPDASTHPKGKILNVLTTSANPGATLKWQNSITLIASSYGHMPKEGHFEEVYSKYGLPDFDGVLEIVYTRNQQDGWSIADIRTPEATE